MSSTNNRTAVITKIQKVLKKHFEPVAPVDRPVLEQLLFACCLENAPYEAAEDCFARIKESFFDWNEVRVTSVRELAELMKGLPDPMVAATNLKHSLHSVFESVYEFDLEGLKKQNLGAAIKQLTTYRGATPFSIAYVAQNSLGGHSIPICQGSLDVLYIVGMISDSEYENQQIPGLERAIPKNKGVEFSSLLHQLAARFVASPYGNEVKSILQEVDPECKSRMPKRPSKKKPEPDPVPEPEPEATPEAVVKKTPAEKSTKKTVANSADTKKNANKKTDAKKAADAKKVAPPKKKKTTKKAKKTTIKKATAATKKSQAKELARRKPR